MVQDNKGAYIASQYKPKPPQPGPPGSGPGSQGNVNSNPADDFIGSSQDTSVYYGNLPQSQGNTNVNVSNPLGGNYQGPPVINNDGSSGSDSNTGAGATGGTGTTSGPGGMGLATLAGIDASKKFLGVNPGGFDTLINQNAETYGLTGEKNIKDLTQLDPPNTNTDNSSIINQIQEVGKNLEDKYNDLRTFEVGPGQLEIDPDLGGMFENPGFQYTQPFMGGNLTGGLDYNTGTNNAKGFLGFNKSFADGGPVEMGTGIESLIDPSDWRVLQSILAAGENPDDYADGGQVIPATSYIDPTADDYFLRELGQYMKRYMPGYDKESDEYRQEKNREKMKSLEDKMSRMEAAEGGEAKPFGGTRENVMDQIEAFDNAPVHMEEPMVGMYGEKVPLTIARKVQNYMEGLDPVKKGMIQEMMNMFQVKKQQEKMQQMEEDSQGGFFGPQPNEYGV